MTYNEFLDVPKEYHTISVPKLKISKAIKVAIDSNPKLTVRKFAKEIGMKHPQVIRVTSGDNYTIDTLLRILDGLDLEIEIKEKGNHLKETFDPQIKEE